MKKTVLIIGNGFDLDLELPTSFSDFAKSDEWKSLVGNLNISFWEREKYNSLLGELHLAAQCTCWFDIEEVIYRYTCMGHKFSKDSVQEIHSEFNDLKNALKQYLLATIKQKSIEPSSIANTLLCALYDNCPYTKIINFNYTNPLQLIGKSDDLKKCEITYVHGRLDEEIVLGCDTKSEQVNEQLSFLYKYNMLKNTNHIVLNMLEATDVYFFGHSINNMDFCYFKDYFQLASSTVKPPKNLTIFTKDCESERRIKDNIRNQGILVTDLYNHLWKFDVIHTQGIKNKVQDDCKRWELVLERINYDK